MTCSGRFRVQLQLGRAKWQLGTHVKEARITVRDDDQENQISVCGLIPLFLSIFQLALMHVNIATRPYNTLALDCKNIVMGTRMRKHT